MYVYIVQWLRRRWWIVSGSHTAGEDLGDRERGHGGVAPLAIG